MVRSIFLVGTTAFWLSMMSLHIRREYFELTPVQTPYEVLPLHSLDLREEYRAVYLGEERVGFGFTVLEKMDASKDYAFELRHQTYLSFLFLGQKRDMWVKGRAELDPQLYLRGFDVRISSGENWTELSGKIVKGNLNLVVRGREGAPIRNIIPVNEPVLFSESLHLVWTPENLKIGKQGRFKIWNPLLTNFEDVHFRVARKEVIPYEGKATEVFVALIEKGGLETRAWLTPEGVMLREETSMGLMIQKEEAWKIFDAMREKRTPPPDLPNLFSIVSNQILKNPLSLSMLKINLKTPEGEKIMEIERENFDGLDKVAFPVRATGEEWAPYLASTALIQSDDPAIRAKARQIVAGDSSALLASLKIMRWTHREIAPIPSLSLPSAREVLALKKGDCNEYTALFTAMARSVGIPTKMVAGLVYQNGRFFYHAWPEVYLNRWVGLDPTFDQAPIDVTHIPLVEGDLEEQTSLVAKLGKIKVIVLEAA